MPEGNARGIDPGEVERAAFAKAPAGRTYHCIVLRGIAQEVSRLDYEPVPIDTSRLTLGHEVYELVEVLARNCHENWARLRTSQGWRLSSSRRIRWSSDDELSRFRR